MVISINKKCPCFEKKTTFLNEMNVEKYFITPNTGPNYIYLSVP